MSAAAPAPAAPARPGAPRPGGAPPDVVVGVSELRLTTAPGERLVTYALGSCLGLAIHDPVAGVAGLLHVMLASSALDPARAAETPAMFVDTGVPMLFKESYKLGARKERLVVRVAGGAHAAVREEDDQFQVGKRNLLALRKLLWKNQVLLRAEDVGGSRISRTVSIDTSGECRVRATAPGAPPRDYLL